MKHLTLIFFTTSLPAKQNFFLLLKATKYAVVYKQPENGMIPPAHQENETGFSGVDSKKMLIKNLPDEELLTA